MEPEATFYHINSKMVSCISHIEKRKKEQIRSFKKNLRVYLDEVVKKQFEGIEGVIIPIKEISREEGRLDKYICDVFDYDDSKEYCYYIDRYYNINDHKYVYTTNFDEFNYYEHEDELEKFVEIPVKDNKRYSITLIRRHKELYTYTYSSAEDIDY